MFTIDERTGLMTTNHKDDYCLGVVGDDESRQIIFKTKRYTETGWDKLSGSIRVNVINANGANIPFAIPSKQIKTEGDDLIITWVIYSSVCERAGSCTVSVCSTLITEDEDSGNGGKKWGAVDCDKFYVSEHTDGDGVVQADAIADATAAAIAAINSAGGGAYATKEELSSVKEDLNELDDRVTYLEEHGTGGGEGGSTGGSGERVPTFLRGLKYYAIGDSIVEYQGTSENPITYTGSDLQGTQHTNEVVKGYIQEIESKYGMVCTNFGLGGHTLIQDYESLIEKDYSDVALVTISYGCNDARLGNPLGTVNSSDVTTYAGALNGLIKKIYTDNPECRIIVLSAIQRLRVSDFGIADANVNGNYLIDFVDMAKKVAERRSCYFIDMYRNSGINQTNLYYYTREGVHPLNTGYLRMSALVMDEMRKITSVVFNPFGVMTNTGATEPDAPDTGGGSDTPPQDEEKATEVEVSSLLTKDGYVYDGWPNDVMGRGTYKGIEVGQFIYLEPNKTYTIETYRDTNGNDSRIASVSNDASATKGGNYFHGATTDQKGWTVTEVASGVYKWTKTFSTADSELPKVSGIVCRYLSFGCLNGWTDKAKLSYV